MKKRIAICLLGLLLSGCSARETFETVADVWDVSETRPAGKLMVSLPPEAAAPVSESDAGALYLCGGYEICLQTLAGGDLDATLRSVTGYGRDALTVLETACGGVRRYDLVWSCAGETGERVGRAAVLDDGSYHYVLSAMADAELAAEFADAWQEMFSSIYLS